jgi:hypothetical protein
MRTCLACQKQIPDDARTCAFCGAAIQAPSPEREYETVAGLEPLGKEDKVPNFSSHVDDSSSLGRTLLIAGIVVLILGGAGGAGYYFYEKSAKETPPAKPEGPIQISSNTKSAPAPGAPGAAVVAAPDLTAFIGSWENEDSLTREKTRIEITEEGGGLSVHMYERATPGQNDMGTTVGFIDPASGAVALTWALPEKTEQQHIKLLQDGRLKLWGSVQFTRGSARIDREYDNYFKKTGPPPPTQEEIKAAEAEKAKAAKPAKAAKKKR